MKSAGILLKRIGIGGKLAVGFIVVICLLCMVAWIGIRGMQGIAEHFQVLENVNQIVYLLNVSRHHEKDFMRDKKKQHGEAIDENIKVMNALAMEAKKRMREEENIGRINFLTDEIDAYAKSFQVFSDLENRKLTSMDTMEVLADQSMTVCLSIVEEQKQLLKRGRQENNIALNNIESVMQNANRIIHLILNARVAEKNFMHAHNKKSVMEVKQSIDEILLISANWVQEKSAIQSNRNDQTSIEKENAAFQRIRKIIDSASAYVDAFEKYASLAQLQMDSIDEMTATIDSVEFHMGTVFQYLNYIKKKLQNNGQTESIIYEKNIKFINLAEDISKWLWAIRVDALNFEISGGEDLAFNVEDLLMALQQSIGLIIDGDIDAPEILDALKNAGSASQYYAGIFKQFQERQRAQETAKKNMLKHANTLQSLAIQIRSEQEKEMAQLKMANESLLNEKYAKSEAANRMMTHLMSARQAEKKYILSGGNEKWEMEVEKHLKTILTIPSKEEIRSFSNGLNGDDADKNGKRSNPQLRKDSNDTSHGIFHDGNGNKIDTALESVKKYRIAFMSVVQWTKRQEIAEQRMVSAATAAEETSIATSKMQHSRMTRQMNISRNLIFGFALIAILSGVIISCLLIRLIVRPIQHVVDGLSTLSKGQGDLTVRLPVVSNDEVGALSTCFNEFMNSLHGLISQVVDTTASLSGASVELGNISHEMSSVSEQTKTKSIILDKNALEMKENMLSVAGAMEKSSSGAGVVSSSSEMMALTIREIAESTENANIMTRQAVKLSTDSDHNMSELNRMTQGISQVTEIITKISKQTNLLALNATIEASRAGSSGSGFTVVAHEIKALANQTSEATLSIKKQIENMQFIAQKTQNSVCKITKVIDQIDELVAGIASAVEEQSTTTETIATNISNVFEGVEIASEQVSRSAHSTENMAQGISEVSISAQLILQNSSQVRVSSQALSSLSQSLNKMVEAFKI